MTVTVTRTPSTGTLPPAFRAEYTDSQAGQNRLHVLANGSLEVTLAPAGLRSGQLVLLFARLADAVAMRAAHAGVATFTMTDSDVPAASMAYVVAPAGDSLQLAKAAEDAGAWQLTIAYQEV